MSMDSNLIVKRIYLEKDKIKSFNKYPFNIKIIKNFEALEFDSQVTFLIGENGLSKYLRIGIYNKPKTKFFLRAESFYNFSSEVERLVEEDGFDTLYKSYGGNLHECSHGESFLKLIQNRFTDHGLYILDEPEAALSPQRQLTLLYLIDELAKKGSQFIIATHSPILISYRDGKILDLNNNFKEIKYRDTDIYSLYKMYLDEPENMQHHLLDE